MCHILNISFRCGGFKKSSFLCFSNSTCPRSESQISRSGNSPDVNGTEGRKKKAQALREEFQRQAKEREVETKRVWEEEKARMMVEVRENDVEGEEK
jgi:hypothetical protein